METKFVPIKKILLWNGITGIFFNFICIIISRFVPCATINDNEIYYKYICTVKVTDSNSNTTFYLENFSEYINEKCNLIEEIITIVLGSITFLYFRYYSLYIIKKGGPIYFSISIPITFFFQKLLTA